MRGICLSAFAESDLIDIWLYTFGEWGADQADRYLDELEQGIARLAADAEIGADRQTVRTGYRVLFINRHAVYYRVIATEVWIGRVLHGRMDPKAHLKG